MGESMQNTEIKKKKGDKAIELLRKKLNEFNSEDEKLDFVLKNYSDVVNDYREAKSTNQTINKQLISIQKEKTTLTKDYNKVVLQKGNLENLCRELQKQKQMIQEDNIKRNQAEEVKRKEISHLFQTKITEIDSQIKSHQEENEKLRANNKELSEKLCKLVEQFDIKEQHNTKVIQTKQLELQLSEAKAQQQKCQMEELIAKVKQEKVQSEIHVTELNEKLKLHQEIEKKLKEQNDYYQNNYASFQSAIAESNETFSNFKKETEKMTVQLRGLQKENAQLKQKWENSNKSTLTLAGEKASLEEECHGLKTKLEKLEGLCRALQTERANLRKQITDLEYTPTMVTGDSMSVQETGEKKEDSEIDVKEVNTEEKFIQNEIME